jgi:hypothetical protein
VLYTGDGGYAVNRFDARGCTFSVMTFGTAR